MACENTGMSQQQEPAPEAAPERPRQVTMGAWVAGGCSAAMLLVVGSVISKINSVDFREGVTSFLAEQRDAGVSMSLDTALVVIRVGLMVCGAVAAATLVFAFFAARRDRTARIAMSVLAVPMLVTGVFVDPFLAGFVVAATVLLWTSPARAWFEGRSLVPATGPQMRSNMRSATGPAARPDPFAKPTSGPTSGPTPGPTPGPTGAPGGPPALPTLPPQPGRAPSGSRPVRVLVACLLSGTLSALMAGFMVLTAFVVQSSTGRDDLRQVLRDNPGFSESTLSVDDLALACSVIAGVLALWSLAALTFAAFAIAGQRWARVALLISAGLAGLAALGCSLVFPGFLVITAVTVLSGVLLINPDVNAWYAGRPRPADQQRVQPPTSPW